MNKLLFASTLSAALLGCAVDEPTYGTNQGPSFEEWKATLGREAQTGKYVVDWDLVLDEGQLFDHWSQYQQGALAIYSINNQDVKWSATQQINLTYCIGATFGANKSKVIAAMEAATTNGWEKFANVNYVYDATQDANCTASNTNVVFDVNQVNSGGQYLARAFFPNDARANRNVLVDPASFDPAQTGNIPLGNILTHELGHTLGFRHEHIRTDQGRAVQCPEDTQYRGVTAYDVVSTMHYPQCGSPGNTLALSPKDQQGVALVYGAPTTQKAPVASILQPMEAQMVRPTFTVEAMVTDADNNIAKVELFMDGAIYGAPDTTSPYTFDVTNATLGAHQLTIKATDTTNLTVTTQVINVTVSNSAPPGGGGDPNNPGDPNGGEPSNDLSGGCNTSGGSAGALLGLALLGLVIRRRR